MWIFLLFSLVGACPEKEYIILDPAVGVGQIKCLGHCPNVTCLGKRIYSGEACYQWICHPQEGVRVPPPYDTIHFRANVGDLLVAMIFLLLMCLISPMYAAGMFWGGEDPYYS